MNALRTLLKALARAWQRPTTPMVIGRYPAGAVDAYEFERRIAEHARIRLVLYASGVGR